MPDWARSGREDSLVWRRCEDRAGRVGAGVFVPAMPPVISEAKPAMACGRTPQEVMQSHSFLRLRSLPDILPGKGPQPYLLNVLSVYRYPCPY